MILLDLFSGIGGFAKGLQDAGFEFSSHYFSEIDKHCIANYKYNFPNAKETGDIRTIHRGSIECPDIITFGSPCQDFSLAGKRKGMAGKKSSLILEAIKLITEYRPSLFIWENVKGTFSSNDGADFWAIIRSFADIGGYELEWQLVNTRWLLPQNRERIYLVGHLGGVSRPKLFPICENDILSFKSSTYESHPQYSGTITNNGKLRSEDTYVKVANCITGGGNSGGLHSDATYIKQVNPNKNFGNQPKQIYDDNGIMACLTSSRLEDRVKILNRPRGFNKGGENEYCPTIGACSFDQNNHLKEGEILRRLTEIECERLQGFPDDWTKYGNYQKRIWINKKERTFKIVKRKAEISKTQRYKMIGNAVTAKIVELIGKKLLS